MRGNGDGQPRSGWCVFDLRRAVSGTVMANLKETGEFRLGAVSQADDGFGTVKVRGLVYCRLTVVSVSP